MARPKSLPIARRLTARTDIKSADKPLLIEVCNLFHNGGRGVCDATNRHLSDQMGEAKETISRRLTRLKDAGWLLIDEHQAAGNARTIAPTRKCLACYLPDSELPLLTDSSRPLDQLVNTPLLTETGVPLDQKPCPLLTVYGGALDHLSDTLLIVLELSINYQNKLSEITRANEAADAALLLAEKKIASLEKENSELKSKKNSALAFQSYDPNDINPALILPFDTDEFRGMWATYRQYRYEQKLPVFTGGMQEQEALRHLSNLANGSEAMAAEIISHTIRNSYKNLYKPDATRPQHSAQNGVTGHGQRPASAVHANAFGRAEPESLAIARAVVVGGTGEYPGLI